MAIQEPKQGTVIWFSIEKGFGFLRRDDGEPDLFVHYTSIQTVGFKKLETDQRVSFTVELLRDKLQACSVQILTPKETAE